MMKVRAHRCEQFCIAGDARDRRRRRRVLGAAAHLDSNATGVPKVRDERPEFRFGQLVFRRMCENRLAAGRQNPVDDPLHVGPRFFDVTELAGTENA